MRAAMDGKMLQYEQRGSLSPTCSFHFFACRTEPVDETTGHRRASRRIGVERDMRIMYQQPHLVPPMKLTVFDDLPPPTPVLPTPSHLSQWVSQGKDIASKASVRASLSVKMRPSTRPTISRPQPIQHTTDRAHRQPSYRPLELSIYMPRNRLSDLPEFETVDFNLLGEIQLPPRALIRARSVEHLALPPQLKSPRKAASMFEDRNHAFQHARTETKASVISSSRPASELDALNSHPTVWNNAPGLPVQIMHRADQSVTVLSPMQEELTPSTVTIDGVRLDMPFIETIPQSHSRTRTISSDILTQTPFKLARPPTSRSTHSYTSSTASSAHRRISQWLGRSPANSISTTATVSTSRSFAEHRRKRSEFYQLSAAAVAAQPQPTAAVQEPALVHLPSCALHKRQRTLSASSLASTVDTNIMSLDSLNSGTTALTIQDTLLASRTNTARSFSKPLIIIAQQSQQQQGNSPLATVLMPSSYAEITKLGYEQKEEEFQMSFGMPPLTPRGPVGLAF